MKCAVCGNELILAEKYCGECGTPRANLPPGFQATEKKFTELKAQFQAGAMAQAEFEAALHDLIIRDDEGSPWMIGSESEEWFRFDGREWQRQDCPPAAEPARRKEASSAPRAKPAAREVSYTAAPRKKEAAPSAPDTSPGGRSRRWLLPVGGCVLALVLLCGVGFAFRQQLNNAFVNLALDQGWGTVIEEPEEETGVVADLPAIPANQPAATRVEPTSAPPTRAPTQIPAPRATSPSTQWTVWQFARAGVAVPVPPGFTVKPQDEGLAYLYDQAQTTAIEIEYQEASPDTTWQLAMLSWMTQLTDITMGPIPLTTAVGGASFAVTESAEGPWFYAMIGPTKDHRVIYLKGTAPESDWSKAQEFFIKMTKEIEYSR